MTNMKSDRIPFMIDRRGFMIAGGATALATMVLPRRSKAAPDGVLVYGLSEYPPALDPFRHDGAAANTVKLQLYRGLLGLDDKGGIVNELAESWKLENDTTYVFKLLPDAVFHNGLPVTAKDVKFSLEQITAKGSKAYFVEDMKVVSSVDVVDDKTVRIVLKAPTPSFTKLLATPYAPILSAEAGLEKPVSAGPYKMVSSERGVSIDLEAFDRYFKPGLPRTAKMRMVVYKDDSLRVAALEAGDVDVIEYVPWQSMASIEANKSLALQETPGPNMYIAFNVQQPPFNDPRVRQAVAYAVKREDIVAGAFFGRGAPLFGLPIDPTSEFYDDKTSQLWTYDPQKAAALLQEAGVVGTTVTLLSTASYAMHQQTAEIVQQYLMAVGLMVELSLPEWGARVTQGNEGRYQFAINGGSMVINDPDGLSGMVATASPSYRRSYGYSNTELDGLLEKARHELDIDKRRADYHEVAALVQKDVPICTLTSRSQGYALSSRVKQLQTIPGILNSYSGYVLENASLG